MTSDTASSQATAPFSTLLVLTDFSDTAGVGVDWAARLARETGARVVLAHALDLPVPMTDFVASTADLGTEVQEAVRELLEKSQAKLVEQGVKTEAKLLFGQPSRAILDLEKELAPSLIVMGTRGLTGLRHLLLGSTAERVVHRAQTPVLTVHPEDSGSHQPIRTVLVPTDFSKDAELALDTADRLLAPLEESPRLVLLHAYSLPLEFTAYGTVPTSINYMRDVGADADARLDELAERLRGRGLEVEVHAIEGYPPEVIVEQARRLDADLIAMGTQGLTGLANMLLGSTAERVVQLAPCPVLTVRRHER